MRMRGRPECGAPAVVPTGGRWEWEDDRRGGARSGVVPGDGGVSKPVVS